MQLQRSNNKFKIFKQLIIYITPIKKDVDMETWALEEGGVLLHRGRISVFG